MAYVGSGAAYGRRATSPILRRANILTPGIRGDGDVSFLSVADTKRNTESSLIDGAR